MSSESVSKRTVASLRRENRAICAHRSGMEGSFRKNAPLATSQAAPQPLHQLQRLIFVTPSGLHGNWGGIIWLSPAIETEKWKAVSNEI